LRALATSFPLELQSVVVALHRPSVDRWPPRPAPRKLRSKVTWVDFDDALELQPLYDQAALVFLPYLGGEWLLPAVSEAVVTGRSAIAPDLPVVRDLLDSVPSTRFFDPALEQSLASCLGAPSERHPVSMGARATGHMMPSVAGVTLALYEEVMAATSRHRGAGGSGIRLRVPPSDTFLPVVDDRDWIHADLHVHTSHSKDCAVPVEAVLATAREVGLGALAIADHNTISGALEAAEMVGDGLIIIVAEEVMTQSGEVIGLFLEEPIPKGVTFEEALSLIREQGGLVYIPHPFDRLRTTPSYRVMVDNLHRIDVIETYNARNYLASFNLNAERFAAKYNLAAGAGSDSHVLPGLGTAMLRMPRFRGPEEFMAALREADIVTRRRSLLYLQSLKLLQTTLDRVMPVR
ncbi:MAG: PHP domain-containing protein, partial [Thermoleophilia bacterium]|nr:PHP domain-containing protein [Thermoleophilia bacterium]